MYKRTMHPFFLRKEKMEIQKRQFPPMGGAAYIPWALRPMRGWEERSQPCSS